MGLCDSKVISEENEGTPPSGLKNDSTVCYMNAMIQAVASSAVFINQLKKLENSSRSSLSKFLKLLKSINESTISTHSLSTVENTKLLEDLIRSIGWKKTSQQDAFDLFSALIKGIQKNEIQLLIKVKLVHRFTGMNIPDKIQDHLGLSVGLCGDYSKRPGESLEYLIEEHFSPTIIDDDPSKTTQMFFYQQAPDVLLIHIQANKWDEKRGEMVKPEYYILYEEKMTLKVNIIRTIGKKKQSQEEKYDLQSIVIHHGSISGGHYICHRKYKGKWYLVNDEQVEEIKFDKSVVPYIMIYEKRRK